MGLYTEQTQKLICLLFVLRHMPTCPARKQEAIEYIQRYGYLDIQPEDLKPYLSQIEPKWNTDIAFRRKDGVEDDLLFNTSRDSWELTRQGVELIDAVAKACIVGKYDVSRCYLWGKSLKKALDPKYVPSPKDSKRPRRSNMQELIAFIRVNQ